MEGRREFAVKDRKLSQTAQTTAEGLKITLELGDWSGTLRIVMDWNAGDPWWSTIDCQAIPPGGLPAYSVASGYLLQDSIERSSK
jgi:hypothetical protein